MSTEEIEVTISPDGEVSIKVRGMQGMSCRAATAELERLLGGEVIDRQMTAEAYSEELTERQQDWNRGSS